VDLLLEQRNDKDAVIVMTNILSRDPADAKVLVNRGSANMRLGNAADGIADWREAANLGNAATQNELGRSYMPGVPGVLERNTAIGIEWFRKSAAQGDSAGLRNLSIATSQHLPY